MDFCLPPIQVKKKSRKYSPMNLFNFFSQKQSPLLYDGQIAFQTVFQVQSKIPDFRIAKDLPCSLSKSKTTVYAKDTLEGIQCIQAKEGT